MSPTFADLGVSAELCAELARRDIHAPFPIQSATIPDVLAGRDVCGRAPTGSGKTLAFGLPLLTELPKASSRRPRALVLAPTRELAAQIADELTPLGRIGRHRVLAVYGGVGYGPQRSKLNRGVEVLVACPGRLEDLIAQGVVDLGDVERVVVDEADRMADMGFLPAVKRLLDKTAPKRQTLFFSATLDGTIDELSARYQRDPVHHDVIGPDDEVKVRHALWHVRRDERTRVTADVVAQRGSTIVFCRTRRGADRVAQQLDRLGVAAAAIHGGRNQNQRTSALKSFSDGRVRALVATDVAARGIHVDDVACVVHFDPPDEDEAFLHRSGRTGRAGAEGFVVTLVDDAQLKDTTKMLRRLGVDHPADLRPGATPAPAATPAAAAPAAPAPAAAPRPAATIPAHGPHEGEVKFFDQRRGFGFISFGARDVFVHHSHVERTHASLRGGERVQFEIGSGRKGDEARRVRVV